MNKENSKIPSKLPGLNAKKPSSQPIPPEPTAFPVIIAKKVANPVSRMTRATSGTVSSLSKTSKSTVASTKKSTLTSSKTTKPTASKPITKPPVKLTSTEPPLKRKRKEYDVKGRLLDLEEHHSYTTTQLESSQALITSMTSKLNDSDQTIKGLMEFKASLEGIVKSREEEKEGLRKELGMVVGEREVIFIVNLGLNFINSGKTATNIRN